MGKPSGIQLGEFQTMLDVCGKKLEGDKALCTDPSQSPSPTSHNGGQVSNNVLHSRILCRILTIYSVKSKRIS